MFFSRFDSPDWSS